MKTTRKTISVLLSVLLALLMLAPLGAVSFAAEEEAPEDEIVTVVETGDCGAEGGDVHYTLYSDGLLVIEGNGAVKQSPFISKEELIRRVEIKEGVTALSKWAFDFCVNLESIVMPDSLVSIGYAAFTLCSSLKSVTFGNGLESLGDFVFNLNTNLKTIQLPESLKTVSDCTFTGCGMEEISFGHNVERIGNSVVSSCNNLQRVIFYNPNTEIGSLGANVTVYSYAGGSVEAFANDNNLPFVPLDSPSEDPPVVVKTGQIGPDVYYTLYENGHADIYGSGDTYERPYGYGSYFSEETNWQTPVPVTSIEVHPDVTGLLWEYGFSDLRDLRAVKLPASLVKIAPNMFYFCSGLESLELDPENPSYTVEDDVLFNKEKTRLIQYPLGKKDTTYAAPDGVEVIGAKAFCELQYLEELTLPDTVRTVERQVFEEAKSLRKVDLGNSVEVIDECAFFRAGNIPVITIPGSVKHIGDWAFGFRPDFTDVYYPCPQEAWDAIEIGSANEPLLNADFHFGEHAWDAGEITTPATCGEDGVKTFTCVNCGGTRTEAVPATGAHSYTGAVTTPATCETAGEKTFTCAGCGGSYTEAIPATGHNWGEWVVTKMATEDEEGLAVRTCQNDPTHKETKTIDKLPPTFEEEENIFVRMFHWIEEFFQRIGEAFRNLFSIFD